MGFMKTNYSGERKFNLWVEPFFVRYPYLGPTSKY